MEFKRASQKDLTELKQLYLTIIENTRDMEKYGRWKKDIYTTDTIIENYLNQQSMYMLIEKNKIIAAMAMTLKQDEDYHQISWEIATKDDEVAVIHILGIHPHYQNKGVGSQFIEEALQLAKLHQKKAVRLDALESNLPARHLYEKLGFVYRGKQYLYAPNTKETYFYYYEKVII